MSSIKVTMKDGTVRDFPHAGRSGGSYTKRLEYKEGFVVVIDEYDKRTSIPTADIAEVVEEPNTRGGW